MKKHYLSIVAVAGLISASAAFAAAPVNMNGYYSTQHPQVTNSIAAKPLHPPTDITISNSSSDTIYVMVPGTPIYDQVYPTGNDHIRHDTYYGDTHIVIRDVYQRDFFDTYVCRLAVVNVLGGPGSYRVNVDSEYCH